MHWQHAFLGFFTNQLFQYTDKMQEFHWFVIPQIIKPVFNILGCIQIQRTDNTSNYIIYVSKIPAMMAVIINIYWPALDNISGSYNFV